MRDKNFDGFFEETAEPPENRKQLLDMLDTYDRHLSVGLEVGQNVTGTVSRISGGFVFVDIGAKIEASMRMSELTDNDGNCTVSPGESLSGYIVSVSDEDIVLSNSLGGESTGTDRLRECMENAIPVDGRISGINKGGFNVTVLGHRAFCPISQIALQRVEDPNPFLGKTYSFVITRITEGGRTIVVSRLPVLERDMAVRLDELEEGARTGKTFTGTITRITDFGIFVDAGGFEGLVHISEVSWHRAENLAAGFTPGQVVEFVVLKIERREPLRTTKTSLSMKQVQDDPWLSVGEKIHAGDTIEGTVTRCTGFGAFVELLPGVEGLIHISEMSWTRRVNHPRDVVSEGQRVRVTILKVDGARREVACSLKDLRDDPWSAVPERFPTGSDTEGTVAGRTRYGYFIDLCDGVTGLLPFASIAADKKDSIKTNRLLRVHVESLDCERRRIGLSYGISEAKQDAQQARDYLRARDDRRRDDTPAETEFGAALQAALKKKGSS